MNKFFVLKAEKGLSFGPLWAYAEEVGESNVGKSQKCPVCGGPVSFLKWLPPYRIKISSTKPDKWGDFMWGAGFPLLISSNFKSIYDQEGLTGIAEIAPVVEVVRMGKLKTGQFPVAPPEYHLIHILWGGANQDDAASGLAHEEPEKIKCQYCRMGVTWRKQERIVIEEDSWDGSDIFVPRNAPIQFMVSEKFKRVAEDYHLTNAWFIPAEKYAYDERRRGLWYVNE